MIKIVLFLIVLYLIGRVAKAANALFDAIEVQQKIEQPETYDEEQLKAHFQAYLREKVQQKLKEQQ